MRESFSCKRSELYAMSTLPPKAGIATSFKALADDIAKANADIITSGDDGRRVRWRCPRKPIIDCRIA